MSSVDRESRRRAVVGSALWAAWGDALGFITELVDEKGLRQRAGTSRVDATVPWKRQVGGRFGVMAEILPGAYSDDTQLRLATMRSIRAGGRFDVEAFSKIELPVWLAYALGAGRASRAAAASLAKRGTKWVANFFAKGDLDYFQSGGNGAAMRIQPHVWAAPNWDDWASFAGDVVRNAIITHGHPRGFAGAVLHADLLRVSLGGSLPDERAWRGSVERLLSLKDVVLADDALSEFWLPQWERQAGDLESAMKTVAEECIEDLDALHRTLSSRSTTFRDCAAAIGAMESRARGSATKTALLAAVAAWRMQDEPEQALIEVANTLGTDTDTIATMAGAMLGAFVREAAPKPLLDSQLISKEADRLATIRESSEKPSFPYPDLLKWSPPGVQLDVVGTYDGGLALAGLGPVRPVDDPFPSRGGKRDTLWQWGQLEYGQHILMKRRAKPKNLSPSQLPKSNGQRAQGSQPPRPGAATREASTADVSRVGEDKVATGSTSDAGKRERALTVEEALDEVRRYEWDDREIGRLLVTLSEQENGVDLAIGFAAIVARAWRARSP